MSGQELDWKMGPPDTCYGYFILDFDTGAVPHIWRVSHATIYHFESGALSSWLFKDVKRHLPLPTRPPAPKPEPMPWPLLNALVAEVDGLTDDLKQRLTQLDGISRALSEFTQKQAERYRDAHSGD